MRSNPDIPFEPGSFGDNCLFGCGIVIVVGLVIAFLLFFVMRGGLGAD